MKDDSNDLLMETDDDIKEPNPFPVYINLPNCNNDCIINEGNTWGNIL